jgi:hypothetical protein
MPLPKFAAAVAAVLVSALGGYHLGYRAALPDAGARPAPATSLTSTAAKPRPMDGTASSQGDASLLGRMADLQRQVAELRGKYQRLKDSSRLDAEQQQELRTLPELVMTSIEQVPLELIAPSIERYTAIPVEVLQSMPDQRAFVNRLAEVAMDGIVDEPEEEPRPMLGPVDFSRNAGYAPPQQVFASTDLVVFAEFDSYSFDRTEVLVKWYRVDDGKVVLFQQMPIRSNQRNYVWINDQDGIEPGNYRVEIYEVSQEMPLLSYGSYRVEKVS